MTRNPRVLFVGAFPPPGRQIFGGMVSDCQALLQSSLPQRFELDLLDTTQIANPPPNALVRAALAFVRTWRYILRFERQRPAAVLLFAALGGSLVEKSAMAWYARLRGTPALLFPRSGKIIEDCRTSGLTRTWVRAAFSGAAMLLCQGRAAQVFATDVVGFERRLAPIISNWVAVPGLLALGRQRQSKRSGTIHLLFVGWLDREKGVMELLEACRSLADTHDFTLDMAGQGNASETAAEYIATHGLQSRVRLLGWLQREQVLQALAAADVFVLPSWAEGLPNAMVEAMAARLAIVVTSVGNIPDVVSHERDALIVPPRNTVALTEALARIVADAALRASLADAAYRNAEANFGVEAAVDGFDAAIKTAIVSH